MATRRLGIVMYAVTGRMMGDGVIDLPGIGAMIEKAGYRGCVEVEIFSVADWWKRPGEEVLRVGIERFDRCRACG